MGGKLFSLALLVLVFGEGKGAGGGEWSYDGDSGPAASEWRFDYPECADERQSPVDIRLDNVRFADLPLMEFVNYHLPLHNLTLENKGHTIQLGFPANSGIGIQGGGLEPGFYEAAQLHFHWAQENHLGSEHTIHGLHYPLEGHIVHVRQGLSLEEALQTPGSIAVLGLFFKLSEFNPRGADPLTDALDQVWQAGSSTTVPEFYIRNFIPADPRKFLRYDGSLTTPPCSPVVTWTVFTEPLEITQEQLFAFRGLEEEPDKVLLKNYRPTQPLGDREILASTAGVFGGEPAQTSLPGNRGRGRRPGAGQRRRPGDGPRRRGGRQ